MERYITIEPKSDDACLPYNEVIKDKPTKEELRREYYPFFEEVMIRRIDEVKGA